MKLRGEFGAVSAELGSLTVEFTRLAQITGNNSYFDAVQRITDALELFQPKTGLPGMWPLNIDTSGCKVVQASISDVHEVMPSLGSASDPIVHKHEKRQGIEQPIDWLAAAQGGHIIPEEDEPKQQQQKPKPILEAPVQPGTEQPIDWLAAAQGGHIIPEEDEPKQQQKPKSIFEAPVHPGIEQPIDWLAAAQGGHIMPEENELKQKPTFLADTPVNPGLTKEAQGGKIYEEGEAPVHPGLTKVAQSGKIHKEGEGKSDTINEQLAVAATTTVAAWVKPSCVPQGLSKVGFSREERFTLGGMADSLYEYLIKVGYLDTIVLSYYFLLTFYRNTYFSVVHQTNTKQCMKLQWKRPRNTYSSGLLQRETQTCYFRGMSMWAVPARSPLILTVVIW